jgi:glyoxylase-like metal-dependent hydrolase (beta-lactamase superfamily II)
VSAAADADGGSGAQSGGDERAAWELAAAEGIHAISIPTPFAVGRVNCYLIEDEPLTLVDTGPNSGKSLDALESWLVERGRRIEELELIVLTHQHMDHLGLVEILARRSGARVAAWHELAPYLRHFSAAAATDDAFAMTVMRRHGVPETLATALSVGTAAYRAFGSRGEVDLPLHDGAVLELAGRSMTALHRPGHSPSDVILYDARRRIALGGDHLLSRISSNPLISRPLNGSASGVGERPHALETYIDSLRATRALELRLVLGGHGPPVTDHVALIDQRLRLHERRAQTIARLLEAGPQSAYELACTMWTNVAITQAFLTLSEVLGHLDLLVADGEVLEDDDGELVRFRLR